MKKKEKKNSLLQSMKVFPPAGKLFGVKAGNNSRGKIGTYAFAARGLGDYLRLVFEPVGRKIPVPGDKGNV